MPLAAQWQCSLVSVELLSTARCARVAWVDFTPNLRRHLELVACEVQGDTLRAVLHVLTARTPALRGYLQDDQDALRQHVNIFVDGTLAHDRRGLSDAVRTDSKVYIVQALSGG